MDKPTPNYYVRDGIECSEIVRLFVSRLEGAQAFYVGNALKYLWRYGLKPGVDPIEDLTKAQVYIQKTIDDLRGASEPSPRTIDKEEWGDVGGLEVREIVLDDSGDLVGYRDTFYDDSGEENLSDEGNDAWQVFTPC